MPRFPLYNQHLPYYRPYNYKQPTYTPISQPIFNENTIHDSSVQFDKVLPSKNTSSVWFDLFGIKLYFDDVLILSLLFFLYKENVKDEGLFFALVLLLIS